jgi:hypothetical protein
MADIITSSTLTTGLVSYWELNEASGTRIDSHGSNDLASVNSVGSATGLNSANAADFEKDSSQYLKIDDSAQSGLDLTSDFTIAGFANFESNTFVALAAKYLTTGNQASYSLRKFADNTTEIWADLSSNGSTIVQNGGNVPGQTNWATSTWYHIAYRYTASTGTVKFTVNAANSVSATGYPTSIHNGTAQFSLGVGMVAGAEYMDGLMQYWGVWSKVLTDDELTELYNSGNGLVYDEGSGGGGGSNNNNLLLLGVG